MVAVSLRLHAFWKLWPETWFVQVKAQFENKGITAEDTKYQHLVQALDTDVALQVANFLDQPPQVHRYDGLKVCLIEAFGLDADSGAKFIMGAGPLGADRPSKRMAELLAAQPKGETPGALFELAFLHQLPAHIPSLLENKDFPNFRALADKLIQPVILPVDAVWHPVPTPWVHSRRHSPTNHTGHPGGVNPSICDFHASLVQLLAPCLFTVPLENTILFTGDCQ